MPRALRPSSSENAFTAGSPSRSIDKGTTTKSGPPSPAWSRSSEGISSRQGTHQVAQMLSSTNRPSNAFSVISSPSPSTNRSAEHTSELQSLMRISYAVFCMKKTTNHTTTYNKYNNT